MTDSETDVIVVGGGGAGLAAAIEAARAGAKVVLLEKNPQLGGTTLRSVGSVTASGTNLQAWAGINDTSDAHFDDLALFNRAAVLDADKKDNLELRRILVEQMPDTIQFLTDLGITFIGPMEEPPHSKPRMHNVLPHARSYIHHLRRAARKAGVDIRLDARVVELLRDGDRVIGVRLKGDPVETITAWLGVVLATGDYSSADDMKARFVDAAHAAIPGVNQTSTGDGHVLGEAAGGRLVNGDVMAIEVRFPVPPAKKLIDLIPPVKPVAMLMKQAMKFLPQSILRPFLMMFITTHLAPSRELFERGAILVNNKGESFTDENGNIQFAIAEQPGNEAWIVFDENIATGLKSWPGFVSTAPGVAYAYLDDYRRNRPDIYHQAQSPVELAAMIGVLPGALVMALAEKVRLRRAPYYALGPAKSWVAFTDGGLAVSSSMEVMNGQGRTIPGLYAAGSCGQGGVLLEGHGHHLGWAFTSGRIAGRAAAGAGN